jgi:uncharacterized protein (TIGR02145 family)
METTFMNYFKKYFYLFLFLFVITIGFTACDDDEVTPAVVNETGTVTDIEGNVYKTVKINGKWWMSENLKVKTFNDGTAITNGQTDLSWKDSLPAYCLYNNLSTAPGLLYNSYAVLSSKGLAPQGWHIATDEEWKALEQSQGMSAATANSFGWRGSDEAQKLKIEGSKGWVRYLDFWPTNESGFSASAGSCRLPNGIFGDPGLLHTGFWWTATTDATSDELLYRYMDYKKTNILRSHSENGYGFSVRCVKD